MACGYPKLQLLKSPKLCAFAHVHICLLGGSGGLGK